MEKIKEVLVFLYAELFLGGLEAMGLIIDHTKDGKNLRMKPGKGLIPRSAISIALATGVTPVFFTDSPQLRDINGDPVQSGGDRTWMQFVALQVALRYANLQKTHAQLEARLAGLSEVFGLQLPVMGPNAYEGQLEEQSAHPGEYMYLIFPGNALGGGKGVPVAFMGRIKDFARIWQCDGAKARKLVLSFCKWGQPAFTQQTGETAVQGARPISGAVIAESLMEINTWELGTKQHDGIFFFNGDKLKFMAKRYLGKKFSEYITVMLRYRDNSPLDVCKGLAVFLTGEDFTKKAKQLNVNDDVDMITSEGNLKQGDPAQYRTFKSELFDFINLTNQYSGGMSIGRQLQKAGINQVAAYDLFTFCRKNSFKYIPFLDSMIPEYRDPLDVFVAALHDDWEAMINILVSVDMITFKDAVSLVKRNLFVIHKEGERPKLAKYKTNYNSLAPKLTSFFGNYVIKAHGRIPLAYLLDNPLLDALKKETWETDKVRVNPYVPHVSKRKYINTYLKSGVEMRRCCLKQPVVGTASIQAVDFVVRDATTATGFRMWNPETDKAKDIAYSSYGDECTCVMLQQMPADCDGDQIAFAMYPAREGNEFERCPVFDWTSIAGKKKGGVPDTEDELMDVYLGVISKMRSTIGIVDNIMTKYGCAHILAGTKMPVKESMKMALAFEYWVIKEQMRPGGKGEAQDDAITKLIDTFMGGREPKSSSIFKFSKDDQGVGYSEGHAKVVNWILINARNVAERELPKIHKHGGVFMYQDIVTRLVKEFPKQKNHWDQSDSHSLVMKEQFFKAYDTVTNGKHEVLIGGHTFAWAAASADRINQMYSGRSSQIMDWYRAGYLTKVEKTDRFNALMGDQLAPYLEAEVMAFVRNSDGDKQEHSKWEWIDTQFMGPPPASEWLLYWEKAVVYSQCDWLVHRRFERALCIQMGILGFQKAGTNGGFAFHCSPQTVAFVAALVWPENPLVKRLQMVVEKHANYHEKPTTPEETDTKD